MRSFANFDELKTALAKGECIRQVELTPALAEDILKQHKGNRTIRKSHVVKLAYIITNGLWNNNPPSQLLFFRSGFRLADGQHRCHAVIAAGKSIIVDIVPGVDSMVGHDEGANRTLADHLMMEGIENSATVAQVAKAIFRLAHPVKGTGNAAVLRYFSEHRDFCIECAARAKELTSGFIPSKLPLTAAQTAVARARMIRELGAPNEKVDEFLEAALGGVQADTAAADLFRALSRKKVKPLTSGRIIEMCLMAFELFAQNKRGRVENLRWVKSGSRERQAEAA